MQITHDILADKQILDMGGVFTYVITVKTNTKNRIVIRVLDAKKPNTVYVDRYKDILGESTFYLRMPQSPQVAVIQVFNARTGNTKFDGSFVVSKPQIIELKTNFNSIDISNKYIREFIPFAQWFSENSAILDAVGKGNGSEYMSEGGAFLIHYVPKITSGGVELNTPSQVNARTQRIKVSQNKFNELTVAGRMAILLHEMSHVYLNKDESNETEADLNALIIFLGLGYPKIEAERAFIKTFTKADTNENRDRYKKLHNFIMNFEKADFKLI